MSYAMRLRCLKCGTEYPLGKMFEGCPNCKTDKMIANLEVDYDYDGVANVLNRKVLEKRGEEKSVWKYKELLPVKAERHMLTLGEGNTHLIKRKRLGYKVRIKNLYIKDESRNPTWSFKDRHCCVAIAKGLEFGAKVVSVSSYGNMGASVAAYAARAGLDCVVFIPSFVPETMLSWLQVYGAKVVPVTTPEGRWVLESKCVREYDWFPVGTYTSPMPTYNPYGVEGNKTIGYEICEQLNWDVPDKVFIPTSYGGGIWGTWKAFHELKKMGLVEKEPMMISVEPAALGPLANAMSKGLDYVERVPWKSTVASSIGGNTSSYEALKAIRVSKGAAITVTDGEIMEMQKLLASTEGLYGETASVAAVAGAKKLREEEGVQEDEIVVCVLTSTGLKFPETTKKVLPDLPPAIEPDWNMFRDLMKQWYNIII